MGAAALIGAGIDVFPDTSRSLADLSQERRTTRSTSFSTAMMSTAGTANTHQKNVIAIIAIARSEGASAGSTIEPSTAPPRLSAPSPAARAIGTPTLRGSRGGAVRRWAR